MFVSTLWLEIINVKFLEMKNTKWTMFNDFLKWIKKVQIILQADMFIFVQQH